MAGPYLPAAFGAETYEYGAYKIQRYTEWDGLVAPDVTGIYKDSQGFLWIATFEGLSRYDGRNFDNFSRSSGLTEGNVDAIGEDDAGTMFICSIVNVYEYTGNSLLPFRKYPCRGAFIASASPAEKGTVWLAYKGTTGLDLISAKGILQHLPTASAVLTILRDKARNTYVLEQNGNLSVIEAGSLKHVYTIHPARPYDHDGIQLFRDPRGRIWTYAANTTALYLHDRDRLADSIAVPRNTDWWEWAVGATGNAYMTSFEGGIFQLKNGAWSSIISNAEIRGSVYQLYEEGDSVLWVCASSGLMKITRKQYRNIPTQAAHYYFTTSSDGKYLLKTDSLLYTIPGAVKNYRALQPKILLNTYVARNKDVWYCTEAAVYHLPYGKGLQKINTAGTYAGKDAFFRFRQVREDDKGGIWICSYHGAFYLKDGRLDYYFDREGLAEGAIYTSAFDNEGTFFVAGIHVYAFAGGRFRNISTELKLPDEISRLSTDAEGRIWISQSTPRIIKVGRGTDGRYFTADSLRLSINSLPFDAGSICFDAANNLWICDNKALYCYPYSKAGYTGNPLFRDEHLSNDPLIYTGGGNDLQAISHLLSGNYLRTYSTRKLLAGNRPDSPHVLLTAIRLFKQSFDWAAAGYMTDRLGIPQQPALKHDQNFLHFYFTGITADLSSSIAYRYRLAGYDKEWSPAVAQGEAEYTGLPPGSYTFEAQARSAGGDWSAPIHYPFRIGTVWYGSWWAICCWILLGLAATGMLIFLRLRVVERRARLRQMVVEEQLKALRAQINPHFLQNTFAFLAHEMSGAHNSTALKAIDLISNYLGDVLRFSDKAAVTLEEELEFAEEYLQLQQQLLSIPFTYSVQVADDVDTFDALVPSMLLQPVIENALKYGIDAEAKNEIVITVKAAGDYIACTVSDTGCKSMSLKAPQSSTGKGIALTMDRMKLFYGDKTLRPKFLRNAIPGGGCIVVIMIPTR